MHWSPILVDHDDATGLHSTIHKLEDIECDTRTNVIISHCNCYIAQLALVVIGYYCSISNFQKICVIHVEGLNLNKCHNSEDLSADLRRSYWHTLLNLNSSRHAPCRPFIGVKWSPGNHSVSSLRVHGSVPASILWSHDPAWELGWAESLKIFPPLAVWPWQTASTCQQRHDPRTGRKLPLIRELIVLPQIGKYDEMNCWRLHFLDTANAWRQLEGCFHACSIHGLGSWRIWRWMICSGLSSPGAAAVCFRKISVITLSARRYHHFQSKFVLRLEMVLAESEWEQFLVSIRRAKIDEGPISYGATQNFSWLWE